MRLKHILILLLTTTFLHACSQTQTPQTLEAKKYIADLKAMKYDELKTQLKKDTALLNKLIKTATFSLQLTSHFSSGEKSTVDKSAPEFDINHDEATIKALFNDYCNKLLFEQNFSDNANQERFNLYGQGLFRYESRFSLTDDNHVLEKKDSLFKPFKNNVVTNEKAYFFRGKKISKTDIGLKRIDSIEAELSLKLPVEFEKFSIDKADKIANYKDDTIEIESLKENKAQLKIPIGLYAEIIGYQAVNNKNLRMNTSALSATPMLGIDKKVGESLKELRNIFAEVLEENDEKSGKEKLDKIGQNHLNAKNDMTEFDIYLNKLSKDKKRLEELGDIGLYNEIANSGKKVIGVQTQFVFIEFPDDIKSIDVFVATKSVAFQNKAMVKYGNHYLNPKYFDEAKPNIVFYSHKTDRKFGVSNRDGETIVKPKYDELKQLSNEYFWGDEKLYWLDVANEKMVVLPQFVSFVQTLKPGYDVFEKTVGNDTKLGVVLNRGKTILPFEYYRFEKHEKFIVASKTHNLDEIYDLNLKKLPNKGIQKISTVDNFIATDIEFPAIFVAEDSNRKKALVDKNLHFLTGFKYEFINPFYGINNYYMAGIRTADGSNYWYGIIDDKGKEVTSFIFCNISQEFDKNGKLKFCLKDKREAMDFKAFLQKYKK
ncbi:MAG: WG repeat-containing protein [Pedobacter sp.]|uniref:WG repeat-containing protein n=1 Tax=Pedobacter sp. TaxID=1411316 RepID=UPI0028068D28|nr:WG repeat-containing protein [Pedobacter sp.]MDQ8006013.1 WG repeat-containing protein [Pedobacter sp.]